MNSPSIAALRALPADVLQQATNGPSSPIVDGYFLPEPVQDVFMQGKQNDVTTIVGWNKNDFMFLPEPVEVEAYRAEIKQEYGLLADDFFAAYPFSTAAEAGLVKAQVIRDKFFGVQGYQWAELQTATGDEPVYVYNFNRQIPASSAATDFGAFHTGEVPYAYLNLHTVDRPYEAVDQKLSETMGTYWINFAKTGNPNGTNLPQWPAYRQQSPAALVLDENTVSLPLPTLPVMRFWEKYLATSGGK